MMQGLIVQLCKHMLSDNLHLVQPALRTIGNILTGKQEHVAAALEAGALDNLVVLAKRGKSFLRKEIMWAMSNICADSEHAVGEFVRSDAFAITLSMCCDANPDVRREANFAVVNALTTGEGAHVLHMMGHESLMGVLVDAL